MRTLGVILILLALILLSRTAIEASLTFAYDPPSVFNHGPGGITYFVSMLVSQGFDVETVLDASKLLKIEPHTAVALLLSPDVPLTKEEAMTILSWVENGGILIVMDELCHVENLTDALGISFSNYTIESYTIATCNIGNATIPILLDVYRFVNGGKPLCAINGKDIAVSVNYGEGKVIVIGDSSLVINHILHTARVRSNLAFLMLIIAGRSKAVFLELHRVRYILRIAYPLLPLQSMLRIMQMAVKGFFALNPLTKAIVLALILALSAIFSVLTISHEARTLQREKGVEATKSQTSLSLRALRKLVREGLRSWLES